MELYETPLWDDVTPRRETHPIEQMKIRLELDVNARKEEMTARLQVFEMPGEMVIRNEYALCPFNERSLWTLGNRLHSLIHLHLEDCDPFP